VRRTATALLAGGLLLFASACSSGGSAVGPTPTGRNGRPATTTSGTTTAGTPFHLPVAKADGTFASVENPKRDGRLRAVRVHLTQVGAANSPTALVARPGHPDQLFIAERAGRVVLATRTTDHGPIRLDRTPLLDIRDEVGTDGEEGLLGLAFDRTGNVLYISYNRKSGDSRIQAVTVTDPGGRPRLGARRTVLAVDQPETTNHKGGDLQLGPDGELYAGFGDGGGEGDPDQTAQDPTKLLGKLVRVATGAKGRPEIWLTGLRNPWRFSFDPANGDLWIGDVGQNAIEEIDRLPAGVHGQNLGWSGLEGTTRYKAGRVEGQTVPPLFEYPHSTGGCAVTGGVVYRGKRIPALQGAYLFADLCRAGLHALVATTPRDAIGRVEDERVLDGATKVSQVIAFGTDADGEVYLLSLDGAIRRLEPA
jgi:glucose/arabinose dehydrogenase